MAEFAKSSGDISPTPRCDHGPWLGAVPRGSESRGCDFISESVGSLTLSDSSRLSSLSPEDVEAGFVASLRHQLDHGPIIY
jgi:hypothetical protein